MSVKDDKCLYDMDWVQPQIYIYKYISHLDSVGLGEEQQLTHVHLCTVQ